MYTAETIAKVGDFVFFVQDKKIDGKLRSLVVSGTVIETGKDTHTVHMYDPIPQHKCYLPSWEAKGKPDKSQKLQPTGYLAETGEFKHDDLEVVRQLTKGMQIPWQAWLQMKAKGVVLQMEYTAKADAATAAAAMTADATTARTLATTVSRATRRPSRKARLTLRTGDLQHAWVKIMLQQRGLPVKHNALLDHGRLMHHLIHGTMVAPSGAMMDEDYAHMLCTVGGADEGNMVSQMQRVVCCQENPSSDAIFPSAPTYNGNATRYEAENQVYESMLHWNDDEVCEPTVDHALPSDTQGTQDADKHEPTAPSRDDEAELTVPLQGLENTRYMTPIQCVITPSAHNTSTAVTALAMVGAVFIVMATCTVLTLCSLASQGTHITGFWLTLTPSEWKPRSEDNALQ